MKEIKRRMEVFSLYDHTGIEKHLQDMAAKGWLLERITSFFWIYRKIDPTRLTFSVAYFPKASEFDPELSESQKTFVDYCAEAGWYLAATSAQMQIFYSAGRNPVPIDTDPVTQVDTIHRAMKRNFLPAHFVLLALALLQMLGVIVSFCNNPVEAFLSGAGLVSLIPWSIVVILCLVEIINYFRWHKKAKAIAEERGIFLPTRSTQKLQYAMLILVGFFLLCWFFSLGMGSGFDLVLGLMSILYMILLIVLVNFIKYFLKKKNVSKNVNRTITFAACFILSFGMIFALTFAIMQMDRSGWFDDPAAESYEHRGSTFYKYLDELPLTIGDLLGGEEDSSLYSYRSSERGSLFLTEFTCNQMPTLDHLGAPDLRYTILSVKFPPLYGLCKDTLLEQFDDWHHYSGEIDSYVSVDAGPWQAEEVYQRYMGDDPQEEYIVCWPDVILEISFDWPPTDTQKAIVESELNID